MKSVDIAKGFIAFAHTKGDFISNKKLQKLLYYFHAWHLVFTGSSPIEDQFEAWVHGPAIPRVYGEFKRHGYTPLPLDFAGELSADEYLRHFINELGEDSFEIFQLVMEKYFHLTAFQLELLSHSEAPWLEAREGLAAHQAGNRVIPSTAIRAYYKSLLDSGGQAE